MSEVLEAYTSLEFWVVMWNLFWPSVVWAIVVFSPSAVLMYFLYRDKIKKGAKYE